MILESKKVVVNASKEEVAAFLRDANNLIHLLPQDKISDFKSSNEECSFKVQGGVIISLIQDGEEDGKLFLKSGKSSPFPFRLTIFMSDENGATTGYIKFDGQVNAFLKMMVEKPLSNLFNYMSEKLAAYFKG